MIKRAIILALGVAFGAVTQAQELGDASATQRDTFLRAEKALRAGQTSSYEQLKAQLDDYVLLPYLEYSELTPKLASAKPDDIRRFVDRYADTPLADRLLAQWLRLLKKQGKTTDYVGFYQPLNDVELDCYNRTALLKTGKNEQALNGVEKVWLSGQAQPDACDAVFSAWDKAGKMTNDLRWQRIRLAMQAGNYRLARSIATTVSLDAVKDVELWNKVARDPRIVTQRQQFRADNGVHRTILIYGLRKLAFRDADLAISTWQSLKDQFPFSVEEKTAFQSTLGLLLAQSRRPEAQTWLASVDPEHESGRIREWRIRAALYKQDWNATLSAIDWLKDDEKTDPRWIYWRARALEGLGFKEEARSIFRALADTRTYHGFMAAERAGIPYNFQHNPTPFTPEELITIEYVPGIMRARELYFLNRSVEARREWEFTRQQLPENVLAIAAKLADNWGWHSRAIFTAAYGNYWDDVELRFPLGYKDAVIMRAKQFNIEPQWIYGIMRQESAFVVDARSGKGALGLMQLMPATGKTVARRYKTTLRHPHELLIADKNINLGSAYLRDVRNNLFDHPVLATAAYNAGASRVRNWLPDSGEVSADLWIETIPFDETRDYVERVMAYTLIYDWRLHEQAKPMSVLMRPISNSNQQAIITQSVASNDNPS